MTLHSVEQQMRDYGSRCNKPEDYETPEFIALSKQYDSLSRQAKIRKPDNKDTGGWIVFVIIMIIFIIYKVNTWNTVSALAAK